jgi:ferredoxin
MVLGQPEAEWPWIYIDPDTCIDCGACVPECPYNAIFPEDEIPSAYEAAAGVWINNTTDLLPDGKLFEGEISGNHVRLLNAKQLEDSEILDLRKDIPTNTEFFSKGPGYSAMEK